MSRELEFRNYLNQSPWMYHNELRGWRSSTICTLNPLLNLYSGMSYTCALEIFKIMPWHSWHRGAIIHMCFEAILNLHLETTLDLHLETIDLKPAP